MKILRIFAVTLLLSTLLTVGCHHKTQQAYAPPPPQGVGSQEPTGTHSESWKLYTFASEGFEIRSPEAPIQTSEMKDYRQYRIYWNQQTTDVINVSFSLKPVDCAVWTAQIKGLSGNVIQIKTVAGRPALESVGDRNALQAGYMLAQCVDGRPYRFEAGWKKGEPKPPIIDQVLTTLRIFPRTTD